MSTGKDIMITDRETKTSSFQNYKKQNIDFTIKKIYKRKKNEDEENNKKKNNEYL